MFTFGQRLKKTRQELSFSQSYLAENIGVSFQSISNWECDTTMPDISQIVPLAGVLGVSTDYLLGNNDNEFNDLEELELAVAKIWSTYSVNTPDNNADYMVYRLYHGFLQKYPLNYGIKYKCALAIHDYLVVAVIRKKFEISPKDFSVLFAECEKLLQTICKHDKDLQRQIEAKSLLIQHYLLDRQLQKAQEIAEVLPEICGIKYDSFRTIAQHNQNHMEAQSAAIQSSRIKCKDYVMSLFYRAKCISENKTNSPNDIIQAWQSMADAAEMFISLYADISKPKVNAYEENPFCYLITAYTSMCNDHLRFHNLPNALICLNKATDVAIRLYTWACNFDLDNITMDDIVFFIKHTPHWCCNKASKDMSLALTTLPQYNECKERLEHIEKLMM